MGKTFKASVDWIGMVENPDQDVNPSVNGEIAQTGIEFEAPKRDGERINSDGGVSTHIMKTETIDGINWVSFPTLFQNEDGSWDNTYELMIEKDPDNWKPAMLEAKRRGELIHFGPNKKEALEYGKGSWKPKAQTGTEFTTLEEYLEMTDKDRFTPPPNTFSNREQNLEAKNYLRKYIMSPKYLERLEIEFPDLTKSELKKERDSRLNNLNTVAVSMADKPIGGAGYGGILGHYIPKAKDQTAESLELNKKAGYSPHAIYLEPNPYWTHQDNNLHEYSHALESGQVSEKTKKFVDKITNDSSDYLRTPTEFVARLQVLRYRMYQLGLYDPSTEEFTEEHLKLMKNSEIRSDSHFDDIYQILKGDKKEKDKNLIKSMNEIADISDSIPTDPNLTIAHKGGEDVHGKNTPIPYEPHFVHSKEDVDGNIFIPLKNHVVYEDIPEISFDGLDLSGINYFNNPVAVADKTSTSLHRSQNQIVDPNEGYWQHSSGQWYPDGQHVISQGSEREDPTTWEVIKNVIANPYEAFARGITHKGRDAWDGTLGEGYSLDEYGNIPSPEGFNFANEILNPAKWVENIERSLDEGDYTAAGTEAALSFLPFGRILKTGTKGTRKITNKADYFNDGSLITSGSSQTMDDVINANKRLKTSKNPVIYTHGTGSSSLPGVIDADGLVVRNIDEVTPMTGELTGIGDVNHINKTHLSVAPVTNPELALNYSLGASGPRNYLDEFNSFIDKRNTGVFANEKNNILMGKGFTDKMYKINYDRLNAWNNADDATKKILEENYPMLFGINPMNTAAGSSRYFSHIPQQIGPEVAIKGGVNLDEISNVFVPRNRMQQTYDYFGDKIGNININSLEDYSSSIPRIPYYEDIAIKRLEESLKHYKKYGGQLPKAQEGEEMSLREWLERGNNMRDYTGTFSIPWDSYESDDDIWNYFDALKKDKEYYESKYSSDRYKDLDFEKEMKNYKFSTRHYMRMNEDERSFYYKMKDYIRQQGRTAFLFTKDWLRSDIHEDLLSNSIRKDVRETPAKSYFLNYNTEEITDKRMTNLRGSPKLNWRDQKRNIKLKHGDCTKDGTCFTAMTQEPAEGSYVPFSSNVEPGDTNVFMPWDPHKMQFEYNHPNMYDQAEQIYAHEFSHLTDTKGDLIPSSDKKLMQELISNRKLNALGATGTFDYKDYAYITKPTETRARLNALRFIAAREGFWDVMNELPSRDEYKKLVNYMETESKNNLDYVSPYMQLLRYYEEDDIRKMLRKISFNYDADHNPWEVTDDFGNVSEFSRYGTELSKAEDGTETTEREKYIKFALEAEGGYDYIRAKDSAIKKLDADGKWDGKSYYKIFDEETQKYYPYYTSDEKTATIGHGHHNADVHKLYKDGIDKKKALELLNEDLDSKLRLSRIYYDRRFGKGEWDKLDENTQFMLNDYTYNVGNNFGGYKNFVGAIQSGDWETALKEYIRKDNPGGSELGRNELFLNTYLQPWVNIQKEKTTIAPELEDMPLPLNTFPTDSEGNIRPMSGKKAGTIKKETSWWRGEEGWIPDELEQYLPWFMDGAGVNNNNLPKYMDGAPHNARGSAGTRIGGTYTDGSGAENADQSRTAMPLMPNLNNDITVDDSLALSTTIGDLSEETTIAKYGGQYNWALDLRSSNAKTGKEVKSEDLYSNDRYSQSASKYKRMLPKYQDVGEFTGFMPNPNISVSSQIEKEENKEKEEKKSKKVSKNVKKEKEEKEKELQKELQLTYIPEHTISAYEEPSTWDIVSNTLANPIAAFGYSARNEDVPWGNIESDENLFDMVIGMYNPFKSYEYGTLAVDDFKEGDYLGGSLNTLGAIAPIPFIRQGAKYLSRGNKVVKPIVGPSSKIKFTDNVKDVGYKDLANSRLVDDAVVLPDGMDPNYIKMYNKKYPSAFTKNPNLLTAYQRQFNPGNKVSLYRYTDDIGQQRAFKSKYSNLMEGSYWGTGPTNPLSYADNRMYSGKAGNVFKVDVPVEDLAKHHWTKYDQFLSKYPHHSGTTNFSEFILTPRQIEKYGVTSQSLDDHIKTILEMKQSGGPIKPIDWNERYIPPTSKDPEEFRKQVMSAVQDFYTSGGDRGWREMQYDKNQGYDGSFVVWDEKDIVFDDEYVETIKGKGEYKDIWTFYAQNPYVRIKDGRLIGYDPRTNEELGNYFVFPGDRISSIPTMETQQLPIEPIDTESELTRIEVPEYNRKSKDIKFHHRKFKYEDGKYWAYNPVKDKNVNTRKKGLKGDGWYPITRKTWDHSIKDATWNPDTNQYEAWWDEGGLEDGHITNKSALEYMDMVDMSELIKGIKK